MVERLEDAEAVIVRLVQLPPEHADFVKIYQRAMENAREFKRLLLEAEVRGYSKETLVLLGGVAALERMARYQSSWKREETEMSEWKPPWSDNALKHWSIVAMHHYNTLIGTRRLSVVMRQGSVYIAEEGPDDEYLWNRLLHKAWKVKERRSK